MALLHSEGFKHRVRLLISGLKHVYPPLRQAIGSLCKAASYAGEVILTFGHAASAVIDFTAVMTTGHQTTLKET
ncbi:hypothetical protein FRB94_002681 [Tulasnella sp. JGI-2019a]|nr:hypothetical protein FRB94_002681 [Tulasnella sp. JGI-2019a]